MNTSVAVCGSYTGSLAVQMLLDFSSTHARVCLYSVCQSSLHFNRNHTYNY